MLGIPKPIPEKVTSMPRFKLILLGVIVLAALGLKTWYFFRGPVAPTATISATPLAAISTSPVVTEPLVVQTPDASLIPSVSPAPAASFNLAVPFTSQAPLGNWDAIHEDTCEEASLLMAVQFIAGNTAEVLDANNADVSLLSLVQQETKAGLGGSISITELKKVAETWLKAQDSLTGATPKLAILEKPTADAIKTEIRAGHPVIVPLYGREIGNPFYTGEGPLYHMLVIRGYTSDAFITNDPGTRHGENYSYPIVTLMSAIGDWDGDSPDGGLRVLVVSK